MFHCTRVKEKEFNVKSVVGKIYAWILVERVGKVAGGLIDDELGECRAGRGYVDQIFTLKKMGEKAQEKKKGECM